MNDNQGSIWRKWDLHVHSPASALNNQFEGSSLEEKWEKYYQKLISIQDVSVLGITDYFSIDGYQKVVSDNRLSNFDLIIPNVELRILPVTESETPINLHVIFDPKIVDQLNSKFFSSLEYRYDGETYKCVRDDLVKLGKKFSNDDGLEDGAAYVAGVNQFKTTHKDLQDIFKKDKLLRDHSIVVVSNRSEDGNSGIQHSSLASTREEIYRFAHCIFTSNPSDREYFLGLGVDNKKEVIRKYNRLKPCIHGSDAHCIAHICHPCIKRGEQNHDCATNTSGCALRYCWIKADPTFDGLKQIVYEPGERVRIQSSNPYEDKEKIFLSNLKLEGSKNFIIPNMELPLNRELITIIGGRGSGKSALLESVAFFNEEHVKEDSNGKKKIIEYYRNNLDNKDPAPNFILSVKLVDKDGNVEDYSKSLDDKKNIGLPFLYIGQEQLSALATNDKELTEKICGLFNIDFSDIEQNNLKDKARNVLADITNLLAEIQDLYQKYPEYKSEDFEIWITQYIKQKEDQKKKLSSKTTRKLLGEISESIDRGLKLKDYKIEVETLAVNLQEITINETIDELNKLEKSLYGKKAVLLPEINLTTQNSAIKKKIAQLDGEMSALRQDITDKKKKLSELGLKEDISVLLQAAEVIQREINNASKDKLIYKQKNKKLLLLKGSRDQIYGDIRQRLLGLKKTINEKFTEFKNSRDKSTKDEKDLFTKVIRGIDIEGTIVFNQEVFCKYVLENCLDRRSIKTEEELKAMISKRDSKGQARDITLDTLKIWIETELESFTKSDLLNVRGINNLIDYLFIDWDKFIAVRTIAKLNGVPTERLSVGQRGTLLLKIYLATATAKQIFIVDQPEDNLDNSFIMDELVPLIREVKKSRQVILSTHNANLVVNADSEQIIVARLDNEGDYISGSIENQVINKSIKEILEGGEDAFRDRENKYGMKSLYTQ